MGVSPCQAALAWLNSGNTRRWETSGRFPSGNYAREPKGSLFHLDNGARREVLGVWPIALNTLAVTEATVPVPSTLQSKF